MKFWAFYWTEARADGKKQRETKIPFLPCVCVYVRMYVCVSLFAWIAWNLIVIHHDISAGYRSKYHLSTRTFCVTATQWPHLRNFMLIRYLDSDFPTSPNNIFQRVFCDAGFHDSYMLHVFVRSFHLLSSPSVLTVGLPSSFMTSARRESRPVVLQNIPPFEFVWLFSHV